MTTTHCKASDTEERWLLFDASEQPLGRMAAQIAKSLMGKDRPTYQPSELCGAHVVVIQAERPVLTGNKAATKEYQNYSGYPGGLHVQSIARVKERTPADIVTVAVRRMLPKNRLGRKMLSRLKVYAGKEHPHTAQNPEKVGPAKPKS